MGASDGDTIAAPDVTASCPGPSAADVALDPKTASVVVLSIVSDTAATGGTEATVATLGGVAGISSAALFTA